MYGLILVVGILIMIGVILLLIGEVYYKIIKKASYDEVLLHLIGWVCFLVCFFLFLNCGLRLTSLESSMQEVISGGGYEEECYKSHIENKTVLINAGINESCLDPNIWRYCYGASMYCGFHCALDPHEYGICGDKCEDEYDKCIATEAMESNCYVPAHIKYYSIEVCDEWIQVRTE